ncbi:unnamed protein product [Vicia faba]|uniref:Uncharacterized protein n=1 Tax=Vicia faba TaxID=3906 RepID=A0AAV0Z3H1_VICFA|nr:unnamed protein product [Vicia faba]
MVNPWKTYVKLSAVLMGSHGLTNAHLNFFSGFESHSDRLISVRMSKEKSSDPVGSSTQSDIIRNHIQGETTEPPPLLEQTNEVNNDEENDNKKNKVGEASTLTTPNDPNVAVGFSGNRKPVNLDFGLGNILQK